MNTEITVTSETNGWIFYDGDCPLCVRLARRGEKTLQRHGFHLLRLQTPGAARILAGTMQSRRTLAPTATLSVEREAVAYALGESLNGADLSCARNLSPSPEGEGESSPLLCKDNSGVASIDLLDQMRLLMRTGECFGGADAIIEIIRHIRWARPLAALACLPGLMPLLRRLYARIAATRHCGRAGCTSRRSLPITAWLPLLLLPAFTLALRPHVAGWVFMWLMAVALFAGCKWLTYRRSVTLGTALTNGRALRYLVGWVGMDAVPFAKSSTPPPMPRWTEWAAALMRVLVGALLIWVCVHPLSTATPLGAGWLGMLGIILGLHFGLFQLLALAWQHGGIPVKPLMRAPLRATSLGNFWGARWNTGFHTLAHEFVFRPLQRRAGRGFAVLAVFLLSGLVHELVITVPARGGYGLPTAYFLLQGLGLVLERSPLGLRLGLRSGIRGRLFALVIAAVPAFWLFPPIFVRNIILPMLQTIGAL